MFTALLLCFIGLMSLWRVHGDYVAISAQNPTDGPHYIQIEDPWSGGKSNDEMVPLLSEPDADTKYPRQLGEYNARFNNQLPLCPRDGNPDCRNSQPGNATDNMVLTQCCFAHHWAWQEGRNLRDVYPYHFHLMPVIGDVSKHPSGEYDGAFDEWQKDPCTGEPAASVPNGPYTPWSKRQ